MDKGAEKCAFMAASTDKIIYTGLRPGEKLYEEKLMAEEGLTKTENELIHIGRPIPFEIDEFLDQLEHLMYVAYSNKGDIRKQVEKMVSTYHPENVGNRDEKYDRLAKTVQIEVQSGHNTAQSAIA